ncbi:hypothetical protein [Chitinophaga defluvii]|uniref:Uncharacterized protein n=1 Tax=Chitinophaga defluvii TaxID=3163343 RepID=A0ABV2TDJ2_9BACT
MKKSILLTILLSLCGVIAVLSFLLFSTEMPNQKNNGFTRKWLSNAIVPLHSAATTALISKINGSTNTHIFFSSTDPRWILMTDKSLNIKDTLTFGINPTQELLSNTITVDSPNVYIYANNISYLISGRIGTSYLDTTKLSTPLFTRSARVSPELLVIRGLDSAQTHLVFKQINCITGKVGKQAMILEDKQDGGFSTDGYLQYDSLNKALLYLEMYQNRFFCLDTNLNIIYIGKTIDTCATNLISIKPVHSGDETKLMPSTPRQEINKGSFTHNGYLFVMSNLRADNESLIDFNQNTSIDVYEIKSGTYLGSFHIPKNKGKNAIAVQANDNSLIVLYKGGQVSTFQLNSHFTTNKQQPTLSKRI